ncbi:MAG TPA: bacillithiol biosynthesis cysteine-adding enzyme BshC [Pyrinomonadaceae bacterium]|nr:bacillithiol biosynthesis cysteine-adding enzyme BshC [Pyrinomonadaceae bacterium]
MQHKTISFGEIPHQSKLFLDFQANSADLNKFYPEKHTNLIDYAEKVLANYKTNRRELCDVLEETNKFFDAGEKTFENIKLLRDETSVAIVTGQQAGLFSGELYTIYKALSAVRLAEDLRGQNIKAVPVFWIAEEDHDFDEVKKTFVIDREGKLAKLENTPENYLESLPVGLVKLDETINQTIEDLFESLPHSEFSGETKSLLNQTYRKNETYSTAFAKFLTKIFSRYGLIFLSPLNEKLKKLCAPIFVETVEKSDEIISALLEKNEELREDNYKAQILVAENSFSFFFQDESGKRLALRRDLENSKFKIQNSKVKFDKAELIEIARNTPHNLSPNALLRPVVQDYLLPTLAYFGGAAEIAYFAQNSAIYKILNRPATPIRHRASFTVVQRKYARTLEKYALEFSKLFAGEEKILAEIVEKFIANETAETFAEVEEIVNAQLNRLDESLTKIEPTLSANLANRGKKIIWHIGALRKKYHLAEIRKNEILRQRIENLFTALLPNNALQERTLNVTVFLNLFGTNFIDWIYEAIKTDEEEHKILYL